MTERSDSLVAVARFVLLVAGSRDAALFAFTRLDIDFLAAQLGADHGDVMLLAELELGDLDTGRQLRERLALSLWSTQQLRRRPQRSRSAVASDTDSPAADPPAADPPAADPNAS